MRTVKKRLIIVEDVIEFIGRKKTLLNRKDFELLTVTSGHEALFRGRNDNPDLIILHLYMPDMNGDAVCRELKGDAATDWIPILIITAKGDDEHWQLAKEAGCDDCIAKPIHVSEIVPAVEKYLGIPPRRNNRVEISIPCSITDEDGERDGTILNLTPEGFFVETDPSPLPGDIVKISFSPDGTDRPMTVQAAVRWSREGGGHETGGAGCEFLGAPSEVAEWFQEHIASANAGVRESIS